MKKAGSNKSVHRAKVLALIVIIIAIIAYGGTKIQNVERIQVNVERVVPQQSDELFDLLNDFESYPLWWPERFKVETEGENSVLFNTGPFIWIGWRRDAFHATNRIDYTYHRGPHTGTGSWMLQPVPQGTKLNLAIDVKPKNLWVALLYKTIGFSEKHSADIELLIKDLSGYIEANSTNRAETLE